MRNFFYHLENGLKLVFLTSTIHFKGLACITGLAFTLLTLLRQLSRSNTKIKTTVQNDFFYNFLYLLLLSFHHDWYYFFMFVPIMMQAWVGIAEYAFSRDIRLNHISICYVI